METTISLNLISIRLIKTTTNIINLIMTIRISPKILHLKTKKQLRKLEEDSKTPLMCLLMEI
jgi:hypothetical protein